MEINMLINFTIAAGKLEKAHGVIHRFVSEVKNKEKDTIVYRSFYEKQTPRKFSHLMTFKDEAAQQRHRNTPYLKSFVASLYPLLENGEPIFIPLEELK